MAKDGRLTITVRPIEDVWWRAVIPALDDLTAEGATRAQAIEAVKSRALQVIAECIVAGEDLPAEFDPFVVVAKRGGPPTPRRGTPRRVRARQ